MDSLTNRVIERLLEWGADLVGVAPVERMNNAPEGHRPTDFMPECKSVVSIGLNLFKGMADVWGEQADMNKAITPYLFYGYGLTNIESSRIINRLARALDVKGYKNLAFMPTWTSTMAKYFDTTIETGKMKGEISHRHAAVAAGIADFGWNGMALTPEFGSMQRFNTLLTSAELEPTPMYDGPSVCRPEQCGKKCVKNCPAEALSRDESQSCTVGDRVFEYGIHDNIRCSYAIAAMVKGSGGRSEYVLPKEGEKTKGLSSILPTLKNKVIAAKIRGSNGKSDFITPKGPINALTFFADFHMGKNHHAYDRAMVENGHGLICGDFCGKCLHQCPSATFFEKNNKDYDLSTRFNSINHPVL